ncbi:hypothetical protein [Thermococcus thioreducens]|uniref:Uncharacterized protein n=1 Tax=Thermococcus thioreducens TaxID=277988 RepID=A0A1I0P564_9EURY|nr:hypothetical protein [Thermococcus thioreducens]SEW09508.1 hypothetical protein SAMN05216170_1529 [Thermococcus thioreducens]
MKLRFLTSLLTAFGFYALGYVMRGVVRLYNPGTFWGDMITDAAMFLGVFLLAW